MPFDKDSRPFGAGAAPGLHLVSVTETEVVVDFDVDDNPLDGIALVPVRRDGGGLRLFRVDDKEPRLPQDGDIGGWIAVHPVDGPLPAIDIERWHPDSLGLLVLLLDCSGRAQGPALSAARRSIAEAIAAALAGAPDLEFAVVPTSAVQRQAQLAAAPPAEAAAAEDAVGLGAGKPRPQAARGFVAGPATARSSAPGGAVALCFALGSCQYPAGLVDGTPAAADVNEPGPADASFDRLSRRLQRAEGPWPQFMVLTGDQVYTDATAGLFDPTSMVDRFDGPYRRLFESRAAKAVRLRLPIYMMIDDHEVEDNFENDGNWPSQQSLFAGREAYVKHQRGRGPLPLPPRRPNPSHPAVNDYDLYCPVSIEGFRFFFADTRTERQGRLASTVGTARIMSDKQLADLLAWMREPDPGGRPRFVVSPSALLPRRLSALEGSQAALRSDAWDGYPASMAEVFDCIREHKLSDLVFLSGDEHRCSVTSATLLQGAEGAPALRIHSIHSSGLYTPYPFANAAEEDFADHEVLQLAGARWQVRADFAPAGSGFCVIEVHKRDRGWKLDVHFDLVHREPWSRTIELR